MCTAGAHRQPNVFNNLAEIFSPAVELLHRLGMTNSIRRSLCAGVAAIILALTPFHLAASPGRKGARRTEGRETRYRAA